MPDDVDEYDLDAELACLEDGEGVGLDEFDSMGVGNANSNKADAVVQPSYLPDMPAHPAQHVFAGASSANAAGQQNAASLI